MKRNLIAPALIVISLLMMDQSQAGIVVPYKACAGGDCKNYPVTSYSAAEIKEMKPAQFCFAQGIMKVVKDGVDSEGREKWHFEGNFYGYFLVNDCKKMSNLSPESSWWFTNPTLDTAKDSCRAHYPCNTTMKD